MTTFIVIFYIVIGMFNDDGHLSPDLVWMLQSNQIDVDALTEALVASYYQQIYSNALSRLTYPEEAHRATQDTLIQAISRKKEYRGKTRARDWIESISREIIARRKSNLDNLQLLNPNLIKSIRSEQPGDLLSERSLQHANEAIKSQLDSRTVSRSRRAGLHLLGLTGLAILVIYFLFTFADRLSDGMALGIEPKTNQNSQNLAPDSGNSHSGSGEIYSNDDSREGSVKAASVVPLTLQSSPEEIKERILSSSQLWSTMWADVVVSFNGPAGYVGPPFTERHQLWLDQASDTFQIIGPPQGIPDSIERIFFSSKESTTQLGFQGTTNYAHLGSQTPWFSIKTETVFLFPYVINYLFNAIDEDFILNSHIAVVGKEVIADREVVIIQLSSPDDNLQARLWLDAQIGISLKEQFYDPTDYEKVIIESNLRKIHFDDSTPTRRKRPENSTSAAIEIHPGIPGLFNHSNSSDSVYPMMGFSFRPLPPDFDTSNARISFVKAERQNLNSAKNEDFHIFADNYHLGKIEMLDPMKTICDRSPDGTKIVMSNWGIFPTDVNDKIHWLDLHNLEVFQVSIPDMVVFWTSFSPDNQKIIVAGYDEHDGQNKLFLIDVITGILQQIPVHPEFSSLAWRLDGTEIAALDLSFSPSDFKSSTRIRVFDVQTGAEKRRFIPKEVTQGVEKIEVPLDEWTAVFQTPLQDLSRCTSSPDNAQSDLVEDPPQIFKKIVAE